MKILFYQRFDPDGWSYGTLKAMSRKVVIVRDNDPLMVTEYNSIDMSRSFLKMRSIDANTTAVRLDKS